MSSYSKLTCTMFSTLIANTVITIIAPVYPLVAKSRGIGEVEIGLIFSLAPLFSFLCSFKIGNLIQAIGVRNVSTLGLAASVLNMLLLILASSQENLGFLILSLIGRAIGGFGLASIYVSNMVVINRDFKTHAETYTSLMEAFGGVGLMVSPIYCTLVYEEIGLSGVFFFLLLVILIFIPINWYFICTDASSKSTIQRSVDAKLILNTNLKLDLALLVYCYIVLCYLEPTVSLFFENKGLSESQIGMIFAAMASAYTLSNFLMAWIAAYTQIRKLFWLGPLLSVIVLTITGPAAVLLGSVWMSIFGVVLIGVATAIGFSSILPSMMNETRKLGFNPSSISDQLSSTYSMGMNLGEIVGPSISGVLISNLGFSSSCGFLALCGAALLIVRFVARTKDYSKVELLNKEYEMETL